MVQFAYEKEEIPYEDNTRLGYYKIEDESNEIQGEGYIHKKAILKDNSGCVWNFEASIRFNELNITVEVNENLLDRFEYTYYKFESSTSFENWCNKNSITLCP